MSKQSENAQGYKTAPNTVPGPNEFHRQTQVEHQWERPGLQYKMPEVPISDALPDEFSTELNEKGFPKFVPYQGNDKLKGRKALITGGDSGIGKAVAILFAKEGADVAISYLEAEKKDALQTQQEIEKIGRKCVLCPGDIGQENIAMSVVEKAVSELGGLDTVVNNAGEQHVCDDISKITAESVERTFRSNIFSMFFITKHAVPHLRKGSTIINTTSVVAYRGTPNLLDYGATKGAIVTFTRCLSHQLVSKGIRVNAVAPGPVHTPLQPISRDEEGMDKLINDDPCPLGRIGQPAEIATSFVFLASRDSSMFTGQVLHPNGGDVLNV